MTVDADQPDVEVDGDSPKLTFEAYARTFMKSVIVYVASRVAYKVYFKNLDFKQTFIEEALFGLIVFIAGSFLGYGLIDNPRLPDQDDDAANPSED